jgi:phage terminase large subunit-like protein
MTLESLSTAEQSRLRELLKEKNDRILYNKIEHFKPYTWQKELANCTDIHKQVSAMCANQIGKSTAGAYITAAHLTGIYPEGWKGHKFKKPIYSWASGVSNDTTRDILQAELFGMAEDKEAWGTGMVPLSCIGTTSRRRGATGNTYDSVLIKHIDPDTGKFNGWSRVGFKSYEMGEEKFFGRPVDWIWLDEQPPSNIYTQCITRTVATDGYVMCTFTPEDGITPMVHQFMNDRQEGQYLLQATWDDAPHLNKETKEQLLRQYPPHERDLRSKGIPVFGSGLVFPVAQEKLEVEAFDIPSSWKRIAAIDFGWDHPTAVVWIAYNEQADIMYVYDCYSERKALSLTVASMINKKDPTIPVAWPKDGLQTRDGVQLAQSYRDHGVYMLHEWFTNPPTIGEKSGTMSVEGGIMDMLERMETGRFKVFSHLHEWFLEFTQYHRKDGKIVALGDDIMSATRYAALSIRHAESSKGYASGGYKYEGDLPINNYTYA